MKKFHVATLVTIVLAAAITAASFLIPVPQGNDALEFYTNLALSVAAVVLYAGASAVILMGFGAFTSKLRRAYTIIFIGTTLWGFAYLQLPLIVILDKINDSFFIALSALPFILAALLTFIGTRKLARLFDVKSLAMRWWFVIVVIAAISIVLVFLPHGPTGGSEAEYDAANVLIVVASALFAFGAYHVLLVKRQASAAFTNALAWLFLSILVPPVLGGACSTITALMGSAYDQISLFLAVGSSFLGAAMFLRSAYSFNKIVESTDVQGELVARTFFGKPIKEREVVAITSMDIVTYTAGLASHPGDIDLLLDDMRMVTAHLKPGQKTSEQDEQTLMHVYLQLEDYLVTKESVRIFTKEALRRDVAQKLRLTSSSTTTFWSKLSQQQGTPTPPNAPAAPMSPPTVSNAAV